MNQQNNQSSRSQSTPPANSTNPNPHNPIALHPTNQDQWDNSTLGSESTAPRLKNLRPKRPGEFGTLCIMTIRPSKDKYASPSARVYAAIKFAFGLFLQVDPSAQFLLIYDDDDEIENNSMVPISSASSFPGGLLELSNHDQVSNSWGLAPVWGNDREGKPKKQPSFFVHIKIHTKFDIGWLFGHIMGRLGDEEILLKVKHFPYLDAKTRIAIVGTSNDFCPAALLDRLHEGLSKHEAWIQANKKKSTVCW